MALGACTAAGKLYQRRMLGMMLGYATLLLLASGVVHRGHAQGWHLYFWSVLPALPILGVMVSVGLYLRDERDEYQRMLTVRALLAGAGALVLTLVPLDFLRTFAKTPDLPPFWLFAIFWAGAGVVQCYQRLADRGERDA